MPRTFIPLTAPCPAPAPIVAILFAILSIHFAAARAEACSCIGRQGMPAFHPCDAYEQSEAVFVGVVVNISQEPILGDGKPIPNALTVVQFAVEQAFRGVTGPSFEVASSLCSYPFQVGERYFVYARRDAATGRFSEHTCGPTVRLADAADDLTYARERAAGLDDLRVHGAVVGHVMRDVRDSLDIVPLQGSEVTLSAFDQAPRTAVTDARGQFEFRDVPSGSYQIWARVSNGMRRLLWRDERPTHFGVVDRDTSLPICQQELFIYTNQGAVLGRVVGHDGRATFQQYLQLVPLDRDNKPIGLSYLAEYTNPATGRYEFGAVPPGRYLLKISPEWRSNRLDPPLAKGYLPGVERLEDATVITVRERELVVNPNLVLPRPPKERWISGRLVYWDGTPVAGAEVIVVERNYSGGNNLHLKTNESGAFRFKGYVGERYAVRASADARPPLAGPGRMGAEPVYIDETRTANELELVIGTLGPHLRRARP